MRRLSFKFSVNFMLVLLSVVLIFHVLVLTGIIPYAIVWGGNLKDHDQMITFEIASIAINLFLILVIALKGGFIKNNISKKGINVVLWLFVIIFSLNTIGNLLAKSSLETMIFTPITFISALLCYRIAIEK